MKKVRIFAVAMIALIATTGVKAQEFTASADIVSSYVFRGVQYSGVSIQPTVEYSNGGFAIGAWGSTGIFGDGMEMDLYAGYEFDFGLSLGLTDYYYPGTSWLENASHAFEANLGYGIGNFSLAGNYIFNEGGGAAGGDKYFELGYAFKSVSIFAGAGDGWHSGDGKFALVNVGLSTTKEIKITDSFSIPLTGSVILNPNTEQFFIVAGITL